MFFAIKGRSRCMLNNRLFNVVLGAIFLIDRWVLYAMGYRESDHDPLHLWFHLPRTVLDASVICVESHGRYRLDSKHVIIPADLQSDLIRCRDE